MSGESQGRKGRKLVAIGEQNQKMDSTLKDHSAFFNLENANKRVGQIDEEN
jgi:hypothetical protein